MDFFSSSATLSTRERFTRFGALKIDQFNKSRSNCCSQTISNSLPPVSFLKYNFFLSFLFQPYTVNNTTKKPISDVHV